MHSTTRLSLPCPGTTTQRRPRIRPHHPTRNTCGTAPRSTAPTRPTTSRGPWKTLPGQRTQRPCFPQAASPCGTAVRLRPTQYTPPWHTQRSWRTWIQVIGFVTGHFLAFGRRTEDALRRLSRCTVGQRLLRRKAAGVQVGLGLRVHGPKEGVPALLDVRGVRGGHRHGGCGLGHGLAGSIAANVPQLVLLLPQGLRRRQRQQRTGDAKAHVLRRWQVGVSDSKIRHAKN